jgi:hypothetical protein
VVVVVVVVVMVVVVSLFRLLDKFLKQKTWHVTAWMAREFLGKIPESQSNETVGFWDYFVPLALRHFSFHKQAVSFLGNKHYKILRFRRN